VVKHVDTVELCIIAAAALAAATDAVLVANHPQEHSAHVVTALDRLHVKSLGRRKSLEAGISR
jgi:hypothetical protein